jgi:uncharacterized membrane protein
MSIPLFFIGFVLVASALLDAFWTIVWVDGRAAPLTKRVTAAIRALLWGVLGNRHQFLSAVGPAILICTVATWALLAWAGWTLVFSADATSLRHSMDGTYANLAERIYVIGSSMATLGVGEFEPASALWRLCISLAGISGFFLVGLTVTYVVSVLEAVVQKRSFASQVQAVGESAEDFVINIWDGNSFRGADVLVLSLAEQVSMVTERHKTYPLLHYFHSATRAQSVPVAMATFDEALTLLTQAVRTDAQPSPGVIHTAQGTVRLFLDTGKNAYIDEADQMPPRPNIARLRAAGVPLVDDALIDAALSTLEIRRRQLLGFILRDRRHWPSA